ncbi:AAA family ATPase [Lachnospiraceae bacterium ZAX-1]
MFTRPRRFGKTLSLSMMKCFFEDTGDARKNAECAVLFQGTKIMSDTGKVQKYMGKYPVISLTLKSGKQADFEQSYYAMKESIAREFKRHLSIVDKIILADDREMFLRIAGRKGAKEDYNTSLQFLSECLHQVYQSRVIILIDEYDVPLENAYFKGFYDKMVDFIRSLFESALKTNDFLEFAVITGCLRISKESIFTGLNNLKIISILNETYDEHFGFTQSEVDDMLQFYGRESRSAEVRQWYNGYRFGNEDVYNPWSMINIMDKIRAKEEAFMEPYWANTSSNNIVHTLIEQANPSVQKEIEELMGGGTIEKPIHEDITYADIYKTIHSSLPRSHFVRFLHKSVRVGCAKPHVLCAVCVYKSYFHS